MSLDDKNFTGSTNSGEEINMSDMKATMHNVGEKLSDVKDQVTSKISDVSSQARQFVGEKANHLTERMRHLKDLDWQDSAEQVKVYTRDHPAQAILIAAGFGFLLGLILKPGSRF